MKAHLNTPISLLLLNLFIISTAQAGGDGTESGSSPLVQGMTPAMRFELKAITHYSATPKGGKPCKYECGRNGCWGGADGSPSGVKPLSATYEGGGGIVKGKPNVILTAVPQSGGNAGLYGCFFSYVPNTKKVAKQFQLPAEYIGKLFYAGDRYGPDNNDKFMTDVSSTCTSKVSHVEYHNADVVAYNCPGRKGGPQIAVARHKAIDSPLGNGTQIAAQPKAVEKVNPVEALEKKAAKAPKVAKAPVEEEEEEKAPVRKVASAAPAKKKSSTARKGRQASNQQRQQTTTAKDDWIENFLRSTGPFANH